jgi:anti-anti-sigma factor
VPEPDVQGAGRTRSARARILIAAYDLFSRSGISAIGVDTITAEANVAKMTLYRNFHSKSQLALAFLELREERWFQGWLHAETQARATTPTGRLLAIFDIFTEWFARDDFEGCAFVRSLLEFEDPSAPVHQASVEHLARIRAYVCELATAAGAVEPDRFAAQWQILMTGSIVSALAGDLDAARKARELGVLLLEREGLAEPAPVSGCGHLAIVGAERVLRLTGELDVEAAAAVAAVIDERGDGRICLDLADLDFVDVAGLRALRGTKERPITIAARSDAVQRLIGLLGWDADPNVELGYAA